MTAPDPPLYRDVFAALPAPRPRPDDAGPAVLPQDLVGRPATR